MTGFEFHFFQANILQPTQFFLSFSTSFNKSPVLISLDIITSKP